MSESKEGGGNSKKEDKVPHLTIFSDYDGFYVNQISNGCCSYMCENVCHCCESEQVYKITSTENKSKVIMFAHEDSSCCCRMFCGTSRPFDLFVHNGPDKTAPVILKMHRNWACAPGSCCCQQKMTVEDAVEKRYVGLSRIPWFCCHPRYVKCMRCSSALTFPTTCTLASTHKHALNFRGALMFCHRLRARALQTA